MWVQVPPPAPRRNGLCSIQKAQPVGWAFLIPLRHSSFSPQNFAAQTFAGAPPYGPRRKAGIHFITPTQPLKPLGKAIPGRFCFCNNTLYNTLRSNMAILQHNKAAPYRYGAARIIPSLDRLFSLFSHSAASLPGCGACTASFALRLSISCMRAINRRMVAHVSFVLCGM